MGGLKATPDDITSFGYATITAATTITDRSWQGECIRRIKRGIQDELMLLTSMVIDHHCLKSNLPPDQAAATYHILSEDQPSSAWRG